MSPARSGTMGRPPPPVGEFGGFGPGFDRGPRGGEVGSGRGGRDHYSGYPGGYRDHYGSYGDHDGYYRGHGGGDFDRPPYPHPDWRRSYAGGEFDHPSSYSGGGRGMYGEPHPQGRYDPHRGARFGSRRERLLMEEARLLRARSHERMEHMGMVGGAPRGLRPEEDPPMDYYLSQPTTPHFPYDRPHGFNMPPPPGNTMDPSLMKFLFPRNLLNTP